jgi:hypothetical protein
MTDVTHTTFHLSAPDRYLDAQLALILSPGFGARLMNAHQYFSDEAAGGAVPGLHIVEITVETQGPRAPHPIINALEALASLPRADWSLIRVVCRAEINDFAPIEIVGPHKIYQGERLGGVQ